MAIMLAVLVAVALPAKAQLATTTATLSGVVTDSSGALVPQASVTLASSEKGINRNFTTDAAGRYTFSQLPPGG
jgi:protocatechuate 3,4-dioxygenase beta subunit